MILREPELQVSQNLSFSMGQSSIQLESGSSSENSGSEKAQREEFKKLKQSITLILQDRAYLVNLIKSMMIERKTVKGKVKNMAGSAEQMQLLLRDLMN